MNWGLIFQGAKTAVNVASWWGRFSKWRKEKNSMKDVTKAGAILIAAWLSMGASCVPLWKDLAQYCREHPEECGGTPRPTAAPTATPTSTPTSEPTPLPATPTPSPSPSPSPVATVTPTSLPSTPTAPPQSACTAVETTPHTMAPGNHCHAWRFDGGEVRCLVDSTIRPICDTDHMDNWNTFCGKRTHDPDYNRPEGSMDWHISGADDLGSNCANPNMPGTHCENSAQRWIRGARGAQVSVTVCIPANKRTPDGCLIIRQGDGCGSRVFHLPSE